MRISSIYGALLLLAFGTTFTQIQADHYTEGSVTAFDDVDCLSVVTDYDGATDPSRRLLLSCITDNFQLLGVPQVDTGWINNKIGQGHLKSGQTRLRFPQGTLVHSFLLDQPPAVLDNNDNGRRKLSALKRLGTYTMAILRVENDFYSKSTSHSAATLKAKVLSDSVVNIRTQTTACSFGQLNLNVGTANGLTDGVGTYTPAPDPGNGNLDDPVEYNKFLGYLNNIIGQFYAANGFALPVDFIQICLPPDTIAGTQSLGFFNSFLSVFNSAVCTYVSYNMHEFGHNLNLNHSADLLFSPGLDSQFGDNTGYMGLSYAQDHTPKMCYNPAKSFQLGWYNSKTVTCTPLIGVPCNVQLGGFVDYGDAGVANVLLKIDDPLSDIDYYVAYNNATGFNEGTQEGANQVLINTLPNEGAVADFSELVGILSAGQTAYYVGTFNGAQYLAIKVLSIINGIADIQVTTGEGVPPGSLGDPHFRTWHNEHYEYHGQCDLVLVKDKTFANHQGLEVQIRTKVIRYWSYIQSAAIRIGSDILEVQGDADMQGVAKYWFNYEYQSNVTHIGNTYFPINVHIRSKRKRIVTIDLDSVYPNQKIVISTWKEFVKVDFVNATAAAYGNSVGMLGNFYTGKTVGRDGVTEMDDFVQFGEEWQVLPTDDMLFHGIDYPQFPEKCVQPEEAMGDRRRRRRLDESNISMEEAEKACAKSLNDPLTIKDCVYDVLATQDLDIVGAF